MALSLSGEDPSRRLGVLDGVAKGSTGTPNPELAALQLTPASMIGGAVSSRQPSAQTAPHAPPPPPRPRARHGGASTTPPGVIAQ